MTERKQPGEEVRERAQQPAASEPLLEGIVNNVVDGVITIDERGNVKTLNPAAERLFGYKAEEVIGHNVSMLMFEPYRSEHDVYIASYLRTGERKIIGRTGRVTGHRGLLSSRRQCGERRHDARGRACRANWRNRAAAR